MPAHSRVAASGSLGEIDLPDRPHLLPCLEGASNRYITVQADLGGMPLGKAVAAVEALPSVRGMPPSVVLMEAGDAELAGEVAAGFGMALLVVPVAFTYLDALHGYLERLLKKISSHGPMRPRAQVI